MRKRNVGIVLAVAAMVLQLTGTAGPASAQAVPVAFSFNPTSGPPGTKINFSGTGCVHNPANAAGISDGVFFLTAGGTPTTLLAVTTAADGTFSGMYDTTGLQPTQYTTFFACTAASPPTGGPGSLFTVTTPVIPGSTYFPLSPARVLDTRDGTGTLGVINPLGGGSAIDVKVTGVGGVPTTGVTAVALNVVTTNASGPPSYLTVWPTGQARPLASNLNFTTGVSVPNLVIAQVGTDGKVSIYNNLGSVNVVADVQGWFSDPSAVGSTYVPLNPARILDTRNGTGSAGAPVGPGSTIELTVTGVGGVPATGVTAVALNVTATNVSGAESFLTIWPAGQSRPVASNLNFIGGQTVPNLVIARVGDNGKIDIYNNVGTVDVVADTQGYFATPVVAPTPSPGANYFPESPVRILDSRDGTGVPGGAMGQLGTGGVLDVQVTGLANVPANATAVALNVTAADSPGPDSYLTVYPTGSARPLASNLNFVAGQTIPNLVIARIGVGGKVTLYNNLGSTVVIADVQGYFLPAA